MQGQDTLVIIGGVKQGEGENRVGVGASIDQDGLLTTDGTACGTLVVTNTICGDRELRVTDGGYFDLGQSETYCAGSTILPSSVCISGGWRYTGWVGSQSCSAPCGSLGGGKIVRVPWVCP